MPSLKFVNLKNKKKINILESIGNVLSKSNVENVSIVDIADEAEISRGTFYNYFDDKNDAVRTYVEHYLVRFMDYFENCLKENDNDFMVAIRHSYDRIMEVFQNEIYKAIVKNLRYISEISRIVDIEKKMGDKMHDFVRYIHENVDKKKMPVKDIYDTMILIQLTGNVILSSLARLAVGADPKELRQQFESKINIIERGMKR